MRDLRRKDVQWQEPETGPTWESATVAVLMDLRDELKKLNGILSCPNFLEIPQILRSIRANTRKPKRKKALKLVRSA